MEPLKDHIGRERRLGYARAMLEECRQIIRDAEYYNKNAMAVKYPDDTPVDIEIERVMAAKLVTYIAALNRNDVASYLAQAHELAEYARKSILSE